MTPEITAHLCKVEVAIEKLKDLLNDQKLQDDLRTVVVAATLDQLIVTGHTVFPRGCQPIFRPLSRIPA